MILYGFSDSNKLNGSTYIPSANQQQSVENISLSDRISAFANSFFDALEHILHQFHSIVCWIATGHRPPDYNDTSNIEVPFSTVLINQAHKLVEEVGKIPKSPKDMNIDERGKIFENIKNIQCKLEKLSRSEESPLLTDKEKREIKELKTTLSNLALSYGSTGFIVNCKLGDKITNTMQLQLSNASTILDLKREVAKTLCLIDLYESIKTVEFKEKCAINLDDDTKISAIHESLNRGELIPIISITYTENETYE